jgi:hypothetical protein
VNPLLVYICRSYDDYKAFSLQSIPFDKYFITCGFEVNSYDEHDNYSFLNINLEKDIDYTKIIRIVLLFSNPYYDVILFDKNNIYDFDSCKNILESLSDIYQKDDLLAITREYIAIKGFDFSIQKEIETNPLDFAEQINLALSGEPVEDLYFVKALKEILPECNYRVSQNANNLSNDILNLIKSFTKSSVNEISVYYNESPEKNKGYILFTNDEMFNYSFLVKRLDGLRMYFYM